ncbi:MAG: hypothetical protein IJ289_01965 [Clostridia bacterium]|nr:hypothetical protein [Clostridia bacterium]
MNKLSGNKKILISVGVFVLIMAVAVGVLLILGSSDEPEYTDNTPQGNFNYNEEDLTSESLTSAPLTTSPAMNTQGVSFTPAQQAIMTAYTSANYYMTGSIYADGASTPVTIAMSGRNSYITTVIEGMHMGVMYYGGKVYLINNKDKKYLDLDTITALMGADFDFDIDAIMSELESFDMAQCNFREIEQTQVEHDGENLTCFRFFNDEMSLYFYFAGDELRQIDFGTAEGEISSSTVVDEFSPEIPAGMLTLKGLRMSTVFDFFGEEFYQGMQ